MNTLLKKLARLKKLSLAASLLAATVATQAQATNVLIYSNDIFEADADSLILDFNDTATNVTIQFGSTLAEQLYWDNSATQFVFTDDLGIDGNSFTLDQDNSGAGANVDIIANQGSDNDGTLRYNATTNQWEISNDGGAFSAISTAAGSSDADTLDTLDSTQFLRSDASDSFTSGTLTTDAGTTLDVNGTADLSGATDIIIPNTESNTFTLDQDNTGGNVNLQFGQSNNENVTWNNAGSRFEISDALLTDDDLFVGSATETISNGSFTLDGDDAFIAGDLGVEGQIYTDTTQTKTFFLDIFGGVRGSAAAGTVASGRSPVIRFDGGNNSQIRWSFPVPDDWQTGTDIFVDVYWSPSNNAAGNVDFDFEYASFEPAETVTVGSFTAATTAVVATPGTQLEIGQYPITMSAATFAQDDMVNIRLNRNPGAAGDTYSGNVNIHMVRIRYTGKKLL